MEMSHKILLFKIYLSEKKIERSCGGKAAAEYIIET